MKRIFFLLIAASGALSAIAQTQAPTATQTQVQGHTHLVDPNKPKYAADSLLGPWVIDVNLLGGALTQNITQSNTNANYLNGVNLNTGHLKFTNGMSFGGDVQLGYFFGKKRHWGIGTGLMYLYQQGDMTLDNYHVEYQATDGQGKVYRQLITANQPIKEALQTSNYNIPLVLKYKNRFSKTLGFTGDAGLLFNVQEHNSYKTNASFDYEAIYQYNHDGVTTSYDNSPTPSPNDVLFTKAQLSHTLPAGTDINGYFNTLHNVDGYNVGLGVKPNSDHGSVSYTTGSVGFIIQPSLNVFLSDYVALNFGLYYIYQNFSNSVKSGYRVTNGLGEYSSELNSVSASANQSYGLNIGVRFMFGRRAPMISDEDAYAPSMCGLSDGRIAINGLHADDSVVVEYQMNGVAQTPVRTMTDSDGTATIKNLMAANYDSIRVTMRKRHASGIPVMLVNPPMSITFESMTNPSAFDKCDGTITLNIARPGQSVTISYNVNGTPKSATAVISSNNKIILTGLCGGNYTNITATLGVCSASAMDVTLVSPPAPPPPPPAPVEPAITVSTPILFEINKTVIREDSHPIIELAVEKLNADKDALVIVNGYTDITGKPAYNKVLSIRRAEAVKKELMKMGVSAKRIKIVGHGSSDPAASNDTPEGMAKNRRAVMHLNIGE